MDKLEDLLNTPDDSDIGYFPEFDINYPYKIREKTKHFPFAPDNKKIDSDSFTPYINENKPGSYTQNKTLICY